MLGLTIDQIDSSACPPGPTSGRRRRQEMAPRIRLRTGRHAAGRSAALVREAIEQYLPTFQLEQLRKIEEEERATLRSFVQEAQA